MALFEFDNVKAEKEDALWKYNMGRKLRMGLSFIGLFLVVFLVSWFLIPHTLHFCRYLLSTFNKPLFTFILVNIIIVAVYLLSGQNQTQKRTASSDIYDEYVSSRRSAQTSAASPATEDQTVVDKQIILVENAVAPVPPVKQQSTTTCASETITETKRSVSPVKQEQKQPTENRKVEYRRSRSMVVSGSQNKRSREFRRSETAMIGRELVASGADPPRKSMDEMSSEEFRSIIDSFIAEKKKTLIQENTVHYTRRNDNNCMSIMVKN